MHGPKELAALLAPWPVDWPRDWTEHVNAALTGKEIERLEVSERRGRGFGCDAWVARTVARLGMQHTVRPETRPTKDEHDHQPPSAATPHTTEEKLAASPFHFTKDRVPRAASPRCLRLISSSNKLTSQNKDQIK
jgi:hypothetical protein